MFKRTVLVLVAAALIAPAGAAATTNFLPPISPSTAPSRTAYVVTTANVVPAATVSSAAVAGDSGGFDLGDAALGAAIALVFRGVSGALIWWARRSTGSPVER
jgi:hypothetical protein